MSIKEGRETSSYAALKWNGAGSAAVFGTAATLATSAPEVAMVMAIVAGVMQIAPLVTYIVQRLFLRKEELKVKPNSINVPMPMYAPQKTERDASL